MKYLLMNKNRVVADVDKVDYGDGVYEYSTNNVYGQLPHGFGDMDRWLEGRQAAKHRKHLDKLTIEHGCGTVEGFILVTHCIGVNDTFWVKREDENLNWEDVSPYQNDLDDVIAQFAFEGAGVVDRFGSPSPELSLGGAYAKCCVRENDDLYLLKRGTDGGLEAYSEWLSNEFYRLLIPDAVKYDLVMHHGKVTSKCKLFTNEDVGFVSYGRLFGQTSLDAMIRRYKSVGDYEKYAAMLVADAVCVNGDRHTGNHGFVYHNDTMDIFGMAPVFDQNLALTPGTERSEFEEILMYTRGECAGEFDSLLDKAARVMTPSIRNKLGRLKDYVLPWGGNDVYTKERVDLYNHIIQYHIWLLLNY